MQQKVIPYRHGNIIYLGFAFSGRRPGRFRQTAVSSEPQRAEVIVLSSRRAVLEAATA